ncbi:MAG: tyrosine-type recombinase/integrase [Alphaproteobacteria bacterium]
MATIEQRKTEDGKTTYRVKVRLKGHPAQSATFDRKSDAKKWAAATESAIREGRHFKTSTAKRKILAEAIDRYKKEILPRKPKSGPKQAQQLDWWKDQIGAYTLADTTTSVISEQRAKLLHDPLPNGKKRGPATVNRYVAALSHLMSVAYKEWEWINENPCAKLSKLKEPRGRVRFLNDDERDRLLAECKASKSRHLYPIVVLALSTGARLGEITSLAWDQIDFARGQIVLHETKNSERRVLPLTGHAKALLQDWAKIRRLDTPLLFPNTRYPEQPIDIRSPWNTAVRNAEIENFNFHDLRHSAASYLAMNGASLAEIADVLGHKTLQMVKRYAHLSEAHTSSVVASMNEKIFGDANG